VYKRQATRFLRKRSDDEWGRDYDLFRRVYAQAVITQGGGNQSRIVVTPIVPILFLADYINGKISAMGDWLSSPDYGEDYFDMDQPFAVHIYLYNLEIIPGSSIKIINLLNILSKPQYAGWLPLMKKTGTRPIVLDTRKHCTLLALQYSYKLLIKNETGYTIKKLRTYVKKNSKKFPFDKCTNGGEYFNYIRKFGRMKGCNVLIMDHTPVYCSIKNATDTIIIGMIGRHIVPFIPNTIEPEKMEPRALCPNFMRHEKVEGKVVEVDLKKVQCDHIIAYDLETYSRGAKMLEDIGDRKKVVPYCAGWENVETGEYKYSWGIRCIGKMLKSISQTYEGRVVMYAHNGSRFDLPLVLEYLLNCEMRWGIYGLCFRDGKILSLSAIRKVRGKNTNCVIKFLDTYLIAMSSLTKLLMDLKAPVQKGYIPYEEITSVDTAETYKKDILKYLKLDVDGLCYIIKCLRGDMKKHFGVYMENFMTITSVSRYLMFRYWDWEKYPVYALPIEKSEKWRKRLFSGGWVSVFKRGVFKEPLIYMDATSLYPSVMWHYKYPYGIPEKYDVSNLNLITLNDDNYLYLLKCNILQTGKTLQFLPIKIGNVLAFPTIDETTEYWLTSTEYNYIMEKNLPYEIEILKAYRMNAAPMFREYVTMIFGRKFTAENGSSQRLLYKLLLNAGYGMYAIKVDDVSKLEIFDQKDLASVFINLAAQGILYSWEVVGDTHAIAETRGPMDHWFRNIIIASFVTSNARLRMHEFISNAIEHGGKPLVMDTDGVIFQGTKNDLGLEDLPFALNDRAVVDGNTILKSPGDGLMGFKDELDGEKMRKLIVLGLKTYAYKTDNGQCIKMRGFTRNGRKAPVFYKKRQVFDDYDFGKLQFPFRESKGKAIVYSKQHSKGKYTICFEDFEILTENSLCGLIQNTIRFESGKRHLLRQSFLCETMIPICLLYTSPSPRD